jgi:hypothetical protein
MEPMPKSFFELADDVNVPHRWHLATPTNSHGQKVNDPDFWRGTPGRIEERLRVPIEIAGKPLDFTEAGISIPMIHVRVASMFAELAPDDVQLIPVDVEGQPDQYLILVATRPIRCIDERRPGSNSGRMRTECLTRWVSIPLYVTCASTGQRWEAPRCFVARGG